METYTVRAYILRCCVCGQAGSLRITESGHGSWAFAAVGFVGLAINRHNPPNSVVRCISCSSSVVSVECDHASKP